MWGVCDFGTKQIDEIYFINDGLCEIFNMFYVEFHVILIHIFILLYLLWCPFDFFCFHIIVFGKSVEPFYDLELPRSRTFRFETNYLLWCLFFDWYIFIKMIFRHLKRLILVRPLNIKSTHYIHKHFLNGVYGILQIKNIAVKNIIGIYA